VAPPRTVALVGHPDNPAGLRHAVAATLARLPGGGLAVGYAIRGGIDELRVPTVAEPAPADALWRTTCCELFVAGAGTAYREFNFSPSGQWAACDFSGYRERAAQSAVLPQPTFSVRREGDALRVDVALAAAALPAAALRLGVSAVLETRDGRIGYWALAHAPGKPDFHHAAAFALALDKDLQ
jgi:hypothetical protein